VALTIDFAGRVALVTGGTKGVGRGIAQRFADAGATVVVCSRRIPDDVPAGWTALPVDLRESEAATAFVDDVVARFGRLDFVVNNAGGAPPADSASASASFQNKIVAVNLMSAIWVSQAANRHMQQQPEGGAIVNIGSVSAERPAPTVAAYGAAKAGLANYTRTTGQEWLPKVRVNLVTVGMVRTEQAYLHYGDEAGVQRVGAQVPIGRLAWPAEIGDVCVYLCSPLASYVSGASIEVHGGGDRPPFLDTPYHDPAR